MVSKDELEQEERERRRQEEQEKLHLEAERIRFAEEESARKRRMSPKPVDVNRQKSESVLKTARMTYAASSLSDTCEGVAGLVDCHFGSTDSIWPDGDDIYQSVRELWENTDQRIAAQSGSVFDTLANTPGGERTTDAARTIGHDLNRHSWSTPGFDDSPSFPLEGLGQAVQSIAQAAGLVMRFME